MINDIGSREQLGLVRPILEEVERIAPGYHWCVAGGAVRDLLIERTPKDYDVFACIPDGEVKRRSKEILTHFRNAGYQTSHKSTSSYALTSIKMFGVDVEICPVSATDPVSLAKGFDYNVCLAAAWLAGDDSKHVDVWADYPMLQMVDARRGELRLLRDTTPDTTLRRGYIFQYRFGLKFHKSDQLHLIKKLLEKNGYTVALGGPACGSINQESVLSSIARSSTSGNMRRTWPRNILRSLLSRARRFMLD